MLLRQLVIIASVLISPIFLSACTTPAYNYQPKIVDVSEPPLNSVVSVSVGDTMLKQGTYSEEEGVRLQQPVKIGLGSYTLLPGLYAKQGQSAEGSFYMPGSFADTGTIQKSIISDPYQSVFIKNDGVTVCVVTVFNLRACVQSVGVKETKIPSYSQNSFQQTLIYRGKVGDKVNIGYREFSSDVARPAFNNDVEYDLKDSSTIGYKGAKLEIVEATNQYIKYRVISNFNAAQ